MARPRRTAHSSLLVLLALAGCAVSKASVEAAQRSSAANAEVDASAGSVRADASAPMHAHDAGVLDAMIADAALGSAPDEPDAAPRGPTDASADGPTLDGGMRADGFVPTRLPELDGMIGPGEWDDASHAEQAVTSNWSDSNTLTTLHAVVKDDALWLAIEGALEPKNAWVVYIDSVPEAGASPSSLTDQTGALDDALSCVAVTTSPLAPDYAWGTRALSRTSSSGYDAMTGFRKLAPVSDLGWIDGASAPTVCGAHACEARIPTSLLGGSGDIALFARLTSASGSALSNQTLPMDTPGTPTAVGASLSVPR